MIEILKAGPFTTIQDLGREGYRAYGVPLSGAMDQVACMLANLIVGNEVTEAILEIPWSGFKTKALVDLTVAVTGAQGQVTVDGYPTPMWEPIFLSAGQILSIETLETGCRFYLSVAGGIDVPIVLGSRSTHVPSALGGLAGRRLHQGDILQIGKSGNNQRVVKELSTRYREKVLQASQIDIILGPHVEAFTLRALNELLTVSFTVSQAADRMGYRLTGHCLKTKPGHKNMLSTAVLPGVIQVTPVGQPIVLLADAQTTGGYPQIACVIKASLPVLAQKKPGDRICFNSVSLSEAHSKWGSWQREMENV